MTGGSAAVDGAVVPVDANDEFTDTIEMATATINESAKMQSLRDRMFFIRTSRAMGAWSQLTLTFRRVTFQQPMSTGRRCAVMTKRLALLSVSAIVVVALGSCSSSQTTGSTSAPRASLSIPSSLVAPTSTGASGDGHPSARVVTATDSDKGTTFDLHVTDHLRVVLSSTYWTFEPSSNPGVLQSAGQPTVSPRAGCVAGEGCGTTAAVFSAIRPGLAVVTAERVSCGEASGCTGPSGSFQINVRVS